MSAPRRTGQTNQMAVLAIGAALLSYPAGFLVGVASLVLELVAIALGVTALRELRAISNHDRGWELAWIAIVLGAIGVVGWVVMIARGGASVL